MESMRFKSSLGIAFSPEEVAEAITRFMQAGPDYAYKVIIGSDSEKTGPKSADFVTAIVCHRVGNGGIYFWRRVDGKECHTLRDRIWREVLMSLDAAKAVVELMKHKIVPEFGFEVHIDVGEKGPTRELIQELVGIVRANNFEARTKPESYAASKIADRHVK
jgi:predicted RNase H-related nuclease YkuK (DUF458 family)